MTTERWRYIEWDDGKQGAQLFDRESDPREYVNLASDAKHEKVLEEMKARMKKNWPQRVTGGEAKPKK